VGAWEYHGESRVSLDDLLRDSKIANLEVIVAITDGEFYHVPGMRQGLCMDYLIEFHKFPYEMLVLFS